MLRRKQKEETQKFHEQLENDRTLQQEQMKNMMEANMERAKRERATWTEKTRIILKAWNVNTRLKKRDMRKRWKICKKTWIH